MENIERIAKEIEQQEISIKEMEEKLKEAKKELRKFEKYRGLNYDLYKKYGNGKLRYGLAEDPIMPVLRNLVLTMVSTKITDYDHGGRLSKEMKQVKELDCKDIKICNDILDEIYPIIAKYMDIILNLK